MAKKKRGRPTVHSPELATTICARLADGESLRAICLDDDMPSTSTVCLWIVNDREGFSAQYTRAREVQALLWAEQLLEIADDGSNDTYETKDGVRVNHDHIQRSRLRVDTRKWMLSKMLPKLYGERVSHEVGAPGGGPLEIAVTRKVVKVAPNRIAEHVSANGSG